MYLKYGIVFPVLLIILFSCSHKNQLPEKSAERIADENIILNQSIFHLDKFALRDSVPFENADKELDELLIFKKNYDEKNTTFNLADFENSWSIIKKYRSNFSFDGLKHWVEITGLLLEITSDERYAQELEESVFYSSTVLTEEEFTEIEKLVSPFIFTKNVDHIHVNLFTNATIKYEHSLKGSVEITQESNYPETGKIHIKFKMGLKRYIELFIRIPEWAEGSTVTEKGVKYVAKPGSYCQIVRKWSDSDFVEIILPTEKMPQFSIAAN